MRLSFNSTSSKLTFLNHASFVVETKNSILVSDPWLEGFAFNKGWSLLDQTTSNDALIEALAETNKKIFFWYSHEHSDHFAIPLLKKIKIHDIQIDVLFQDTLDRRVTNYLESNEIKVRILQDGQVFQIDQELSFLIHSWRSGDSLSYINVGDVGVLNINDCIVAKESEAQKIKKILNGHGYNVDFLFSQFGYANWEGNENDTILRKHSADEKLRRLSLQNTVFEPKIIVPFASFVYFSHPENFYLNDEQNCPSRLRSSQWMKESSYKTVFLKPYDQFELTDCDASRDLLFENSTEAEKHWNSLFHEIAPVPSNETQFSLESIVSYWKNFLGSVTHQFLGLFQVLEAFRLIQPLTIRVTDLDVFVHFSYLWGIRSTSESGDYDLSMTSEVLAFSLKHEFGFDTTLVNGRFRVSRMGKNRKAMKFLGVQNLLKNGFGYRRPISTFCELLRLSKREED